MLPHIIPVLVWMVLQGLVVVVLTRIGSRKRIKARHEVEENGSKGEQVHCRAIVLHLLPYFRCHVPWVSFACQVVARAESLRFRRASFSCTGKAEPDDLDIVGSIVNHNIIGGKLTM